VRREPAPVLPASAERRREHLNATRAVPRPAIDRALTRRDVPLREKTLWRMLYETAARASEVLALNIEDLDLDARRAPIRSKGGDTEWICWGSGTAHLLPRLIRGRQAGPVFLSERRPGPPAAPQPGTCAPPPDGPGSAMTAPGSCSPGTPGGNCTSCATPRPPTSANKVSRCS
jgi:integrase